MSETAISDLIYVGDPMCSWCWGFAPEIESLSRDHEVEVVVGGLRPGPAAQVLDEGMAGYLGKHWVEIAEQTGQPFDTRFLRREDGWLYDTEPADIAVTVMRELHRDNTLAYFTSIQRAFYAEGRDVTDFVVLGQLAGDAGVDRAEFTDRLRSPEAKQTAWADFTRVRDWGINGFPTLLAALPEDRLAVIARGWTPARLIRQRLDQLPSLVPGPR